MKPSKNKLFKFSVIFILVFTAGWVKPLALRAQDSETQIATSPLGEEPMNYAGTSVLATGKWIKIGLTETGVYKIDRELLQQMGFDVAHLDPRNLALFGNGGRMLPEANNAARYDDLFENAIYFPGENDGQLDEGDAIYFYGEGTTQWALQNNRFVHQINYYSDTNYYFLSLLNRPGKRIQLLNQAEGGASKETNHYLKHISHERDLVNLILSGKEWYGEEINSAQPQMEFNFPFPDRETNKAVNFDMKIAGRSISEAFSFDVLANATPIIQNVNFVQLNPGSSTFAWEVYRNINFVSDQPDLTILLNINAAYDNAKAWLAYMRINAWCKLVYHPNQQLFFSNPEVVLPNNITRFIIQTNGNSPLLWDVTKPLAPMAQAFDIADNELSFKAKSDSLHSYILFEPANALIPHRFVEIANQNLHAIETADMLIVAPPMFLNQAIELASVHYADDGLNSVVVNLEEIYNEFGSGKADITAIRDFVRMVYRKSGLNLAYLLLFGDGSYDYKNRVENNSNHVPTYEASGSLTETYSYVSDDYFGLLDLNEGAEMAGVLDIGIGRFPVNTPDEAQLMVEKVKHYLIPGTNTCGDWRNNILFMADDSDFNMHLEQAETLSSKVDTAYQSMNISKVYIDGFIRTTVPGGYLFPDAAHLVLEKINEGLLVFNYTGHGGINGLTDEKVLPISAIENLSNFDKMPFFITATCEFSRFDNPAFVSAGERLLLNPKGGAIALMTTTRLAFAHSNFAINKKVFDNIFEPGKMRMRRFGDIIRLSKNPSGININNFVLLGDPALRPAYPKLSVKLNRFNSHPANEQTDTLGAMAKVSIEGIIADVNGEKVNNFNGYLYAKMFDKKTVFKTLGNDTKSNVAPFSYYDNLIFKGTLTIKEGAFSFEFLVPKDIAYQVGRAKLSFYATDSLNFRDAGGYYNNMMLGGFDSEAILDSQGPQISMYINDSGFVDGSVIQANPLVYISLQDPQGIHFLGNSIGRNITLKLEGPVSELYYLDSYYRPALDAFDRGSLVFPLGNLPNGNYKITVKAWDLHNNSSQSVLNFVIDPHKKLDVTHIQNIPNPVGEYTDFMFRHNKTGQKLRIAIRIYNSSGRAVALLEGAYESGNHTAKLRWYGRDNNGKRLPAGLYLYSASITDEDGDTHQASQKLVLLPQNE